MAIIFSAARRNPVIKTTRKTKTKNLERRSRQGFGGDYKFREEDFDFDIERVQREMLDGAKKHRGRPAQSSEASHALPTAQRLRLIWKEPSAQSSGAFYTEDSEDFEILTEIQHYGGKTNLIDFTTDYRIALFFACDGDYDKEGRVVLQKNDSIDGEIQTPWNPRHRVIAQKSVFVRPRKGYIDPKKEDVVEIPAALKEPMLEHLEKYHGIDKEAVYNDLHGFIYNQDRHGEFYTRFFRGYAYANEGKYDEAIKHYDAAIKLNPRIAEAYISRGIAYSEKDELDIAIRDYNKAIELEPNNLFVYTNRSVAYHNKGDFDNAIRDYNKLIELEPNNPTTYTNRGCAYASKNDLDAAIKDFDKAIEHDQNFTEAYIRRGIAYGQKDDLDAAIKDFDKAIEHDQNNPLAYNTRGIAYVQKKDLETAIKDFYKAIEIDSDAADPIIYSVRGIAWLHKKEWDKARSDLKTAKDKEIDIIDSFHNGYDYESVADFEQKTGIKLPLDIAAMLTPNQ